MRNDTTELYLKPFRIIYTFTFILGLISLLIIIVGKLAYPHPLFTIFSMLAVILFGVGFLIILLASVLALVQVIKKKKFTNEIEIPLLTGLLIKILIDYF